MVKVLDSHSMGGWVASMSLPRSTKSVPGSPGDLVLKSKLSLRSGSVALRQLNPIHKKEPSSFF